MKKILYCLLLGIILFASFKTYENYSLYRNATDVHLLKMSDRPRVSLTDNQILIAHGGGALEVKADYYSTVTNAIEAFNQNYHNGLRWFEIDFSLTSDNKIIGRHDWHHYLYENYLGQVDPVENDQPLSYTEAKNLEIYRKYHAATAKTIVDFLVKHTDARIIIDTKNQETEEYLQILEEINKSCDVNKEVLSRIIPQIYTTDQYEPVSKLGYYENLLLTLYSNNETNPQIIDFVKNNKKIIAVAFGQDAYYQRKDLIVPIHELGKEVFIFSVDKSSDATRYFNEGIDGIYTNFLIPQH
ncbi:hypothetical protein K5E_21390 [Enterococcus thailandicus]|nr:hypothetical protein K4E_03490 [Enterococcus thailandicus]GMC10000.1 hypothetical protein K5E_21390 [Enterococcus thailandicus]